MTLNKPYHADYKNINKVNKQLQKKEVNINKKIVNNPQETILLISIISPSKLKEGGAAILEEHNKNHHKEKLGIKLIKPLFKNKLRLPRRS